MIKIYFKQFLLVLSFRQLIKIFSYLNFTPVSELHKQFKHVVLEQAFDIYYDINTVRCWLDSV